MKKRNEYHYEDKIGTCLFIKEIDPIVFEITDTNKTKSIKRCAIFRCNCGKEFTSIIAAVKKGNTKSCGCLGISWCKKMGNNNSTHGKRTHPLYKMWQGMLRRCNNSKDNNYHNYGGRGIKVCDRWKDINNFIDDMYSLYIPGLDLDRINNNGDYEPSNCRWVTRKVNCNNRRDSIFIEYNGYKKTISEWADYLNIPYSVITYRLKSWSVDKIFTTPYPSRKYNKT